VKRDGVRKPDVKTVRIGLMAALAAVAIVIGAIALLGDNSEEATPAASTSPPPAEESRSLQAVTLSEPELLAVASELARPAYWLGHRAESDFYELTNTADGRVYVRYLLPGAEAGDPRPDFVTIGTYPVAEAKRALRSASKTQEGMKLTRLDGFEVLSSDKSTSAYVVFDDEPELQIEVFSPRPGEANLLAIAGTVKPVE
jgi:hypothetical protein